MQWHQLNHMQTIWTLLQTDNHTNTWSLNLCRPDTLPDIQPSVSKHWRQLSKQVNIIYKRATKSNLRCKKKGVLESELEGLLKHSLTTQTAKYAK